jgi:hypothetical protein
MLHSFSVITVIPNLKSICQFLRSGGLKFPCFCKVKVCGVNLVATQSIPLEVSVIFIVHLYCHCVCVQCDPYVAGLSIYKSHLRCRAFNEHLESILLILYIASNVKRLVFEL